MVLATDMTSHFEQLRTTKVALVGGRYEELDILLSLLSVHIDCLTQGESGKNIGHGTRSEPMTVCVHAYGELFSGC